jgi:glycosyltransferase involved in cell wall biosynthesis
MRILHSESSIAWGGQENRIGLECSGMVKRGHDVSLIIQPQSKLYERLKDTGIKICPIQMRRGLDLKAIFKTLKFLKENEIQIVHTHSSIDSWIVGLAARLYRHAMIIRTRHVATPVGSIFSYRYLCHRLITTGENIRRIFIDNYKLPENKVISIPTGVDLGFFSPDVTGERVREELGLGKDAPLLGHVGIFRGKKGHRFFLEACSVIKKTFPHARFLIVGEGPIEKHIREWVKELSLENEVIFTGFREDINEVLASLDILVMSSVAEGVPQVISQALAMGKGVVASSVGGIPELIRNGSTGLLVPPEDGRSIAEACLKLLGDKSLIRRLGQAGKKLIEEKFSLEAMLDKIEQIYSPSLREEGCGKSEG